MSQLYRHLLIPKNPEFVPELESVVDFYKELAILGALPQDRKYVVVTLTGKTRVWGRNPKTGEIYQGPELEINKFQIFQQAMDCVRGKTAFDICARGIGAREFLPFELYGANRPDAPWNGPYELSVYCKLREKPSRLLCSPLTCKCVYNPDEPGIFKNPWNDADIENSGPAWARFTVEFGVADWLWPMISDSLDILDTRLVDAATAAFGVKFTQGCITSDD